MDDTQDEIVERPDPTRLRYWTRLIRQLRNPWPPRSILPARSSSPPRSPAPTRQPLPARLGDDA